MASYHTNAEGQGAGVNYRQNHSGVLTWKCVQVNEGDFFYYELEVEY